MGCMAAFSGWVVVELRWWLGQGRFLWAVLLMYGCLECGSISLRYEARERDSCQKAWQHEL